GATVERLDAHVNGDPARIAVQTTLTGVHAPEQMQAQLPSGPVTLNTEVAFNTPGVFDRLSTNFSLTATGLHVEGSGSADIPNRSGELNLSASLPAMTPVANVGWQ